jgi:hypothetical protein
VRALRTYRFGPHAVVVLELVDDEEVSYPILVDGQPIVDTLLPVPPTLEDVVRLYAQWQQPEPAAGDQPDDASA